MSYLPARPEEASLLAEVLRDPFEDFECFHVTKWFRALKENFPLLSFQVHHYACRQQEGVPRIEPLPRLISSLLADDGIPQEEQICLNELEASLDRRRYSLANELTYHESVEESGMPRLHPNYTMFRWAPDLAGCEMTDEDGGSGYVSPYEDLGRNISAAVEARDHALGKPARRLAEAEIDELLRSAGITRKRGRQPSPLPDALRDALVAETAELITLVLTTDAPPLSDRAQGVFDNHGIPADARATWVYRLALPVLSSYELEALLAYPREELQHRPSTPKRLAAHMLERRLGLPRGKILRNVFGDAQATAAAGRNNPFRTR
jgi:hypothetical protein